MEVVGHVDNVVNDVTDLVDWELLEIPIGCWRGDRNRLSGKLLLQDPQEVKIIFTLFLGARVIIGKVGSLVWVTLATLSNHLSTEIRREGDLRQDTPSLGRRHRGRCP